jgi:hypothetical protein
VANTFSMIEVQGGYLATATFDTSGPLSPVMRLGKCDQITVTAVGEFDGGSVQLRASNVLGGAPSGTLINLSAPGNGALAVPFAGFNEYVLVFSGGLGAQNVAVTLFGRIDHHVRP